MSKQLYIFSNQFFSDIVLIEKRLIKQIDQTQKMKIAANIFKHRKTNPKHESRNQGATQKLRSILIAKTFFLNGNYVLKLFLRAGSANKESFYKVMIQNMFTNYLDPF